MSCFLHTLQRYKNKSRKQNIRVFIYKGLLMKLIGLTFAAFFIFLIFNMISIRKFGMKSCLSEYGKLWGDAVPIKNMNLWSIVLAIISFLMVPPIVQSMDGNPFQFIGFLAPLYLFLVILTPNYKENKKANIIHQIGAYTCAIGMLVWMVVLMHMWIPVVACIALFLAIGFSANNLKYAITYYVELALFMATYWVLLSY